jgi:NADPH2:quinone reductase
MRAIQIQTYGGPEVLAHVDVPEPRVGGGQALIEVEAAGVNFIDIVYRRGVYKVPTPFTLGVEAAGTVSEVSPDVQHVKVGDRVACAQVSTSYLSGGTVLGTYAQFAVAPAEILVPLPESIDAATGAALMLQGMWAHALSRDCFPLKSGQTAFFHAGAGGVGLLLTQLAAGIGVRVFVTVGT